MLKIRPNFALFTPVKIREGVDRITGSINAVLPMTEPTEYI